MALFSEKYGYKKARDSFQHERIDDNLKIALWNIIYSKLISDTYALYAYSESYKVLYQYLWERFFHKKSNNFYSHDFPNFLEHWFFDEIEWYEIYDLLQTIVLVLKLQNRNYCIFTAAINNELTRYLASYRFVDIEIIEINSDEEIKEIETAVNSPIEEINIQLQNALHKLSDRENPDYRHSIKESISAVECICRKITGKGTLGKAIADLEKKGLELNSQLKGGLNHLYNYTNDENGIRHSIMDMDEEVNMEEARFMLITCSAFVNYLLEKANKLKIDL